MSPAFLSRAFPDMTRFFRWWAGELKAVPPQWLKTLLVPGRSSLLLDIGESRLTVTYRTRESTERLGEVELAGSTPEQQRRELAQLTAQLTTAQKAGNAEVVLRLPAAQSIRWRLAFPSSAASDLPQAIAFQISQKTPFQAQETCYDYRIAERSSDGGKIWVEVALVPRQRLLRVLAQTQAWKVPPDRIDVAAPEDDGTEGIDRDLGFNLMPQDRKAKSGRPIARLNAALATIVAGLLLSSLALPILEQRRELQKLEEQLADSRRDAKATRRLQDEVEELSRQRGFLSAMKQSRPLKVVVLEELTRTLPDHTFLSELRIKGPDVSITGSSRSASSLVERLESSQLFQAPRFRSSVTQDPRNGLERFSLSFELGLEADSDEKR